MSPATNQQDSETEIHRGPNQAVLRVVDPVDGPLIIKRGVADSPARTSRAAVHNERRILERLQGLPGCPCLVRFDPARGELAVADFGGVPLSQSDLLGQLDLERFLALSEALAGIVAAIHGRGVIHKQLNPANILVRPDDLQLQISGFELATTFAEERPEFDHPSRLLGSPAYLSPEQTGRMNRPVDYRTDLYSLGATLYALATGAPPFDEADTLSLIHAHLARSPLPPQDRAPWLPPHVSALILTLLAKEPDDRYQSAAGVAHDLRQFRQALTESHSLEQVQLRQQDWPLSPRPPRRLYGRNRELAILTAAFASVTTGGAQGLFVAGYSGVGKTSLIHEIHRPVTLSRGLFIRGKFEQFSRERPFLAPTQSLRQLCQLLLAEPKAVVAQWRQRILAGVGPDAGALFEVVPELESLLGPQASPPELGPRETQVRLHTLLVALVRQVAAPAHPLVLFLDDLQWADQPSLDFIGALLEEPALDGVLLIGAYRDNEVDAAHPLRRLLRQPTATGEPATVLALSSLAEGDLADLLADMLHMPREAVQSLAAALYAKTSGNPFFTIGFLELLYREGTLRPDPEQGRWQWDADAIAAHSASANLVDSLVARLAESASDTAETLVAAACLGNTCTLGRLALATGTDAGALADRLTPAMECGMIVTPSASAFQQADSHVQIRFCHDRMQQAVYQLHDDAWRGELHLAMARRFAQAGDDPAQHFSAAEHYANAVPLIVDTAERALARELFLRGAMHARQSGAFATAEHFLRLGIELLADSGHEREATPLRTLTREKTGTHVVAQVARLREFTPNTRILANSATKILNGVERGGLDIWKKNPGAAFALHVELHQILYSQSRDTEADQVYALLDANADSPSQLVPPACVQIASLSNRTDYDGAIRLGCALLDRLGIAVPLDNPRLSLERELDLFYQHAASAALDRLPARSASAVPRLNSVATLMSRLCTAAFFSQPLVGGWMAVRCGRQWLETGYEEASIYAVACISLMTIALRGDYATAYRVAGQALSIGLAHERGTETARAQHVMGLGISHWFRPLEEDLEYARAAFDGLSRGGDLEFACFTFGASQSALLDTCADLASMNAETDLAIGFARKHGNHHAEQTFLSFRQVVRALAGKTAAPGSFDDAEFNEAAHLATARGNPNTLCFFHIYRALAAVMFQDDAALVRHAEIAASLTLHITGFYPTALANLLHSLALIQQIRAGGDGQRPALLERLASNQIWLAARAADAPMNFSHLYDLVEAERLELLDQPWNALRMFEQAMRQAQAHQRPWHQGLATERAGLFCLRHGMEYAGRQLLTRAHDVYQRWGATGKARAMCDAWPFLDAGPETGSSRSSGEGLDYQALLRASQTLASERSLPRLVTRVAEVLGQLTGATDVRLMLLDEDGQWHLEGGLRGSEPLERQTLREAEERRTIAASVLRLGLTTLQPLISEDAVLDSRFASDPHFADLPLCSLLALPVLVHGRVSAFLTVENRLFRAAFTAQRVETVSLLCAQLAISLENARLYQSLEHKVSERTQALESSNLALQEASRCATAASAAKSEFLANMSHEIRTPITAVIGYAEMLLDPRLAEPEQAKAVHAIRRNSTHLLQVINDILDLAKLDADKVELDVVPCVPWEIVQDALSSLRVRAEEKDVHLAIRVSGRWPGTCTTDPIRVRQILINLIGNAIKFTAPGRQVLIRLSAQRDPARLCFEVEDQGIGMSEDQLARLFEPFEQADRSFTRKYGGTGLGLSIVRRLTDILGGDIQVRSVLGQGSLFTFQLPLSGCGEAAWLDECQLDAAVSRDDPDGAAECLPVLTGRVLLAEDSEDIREVLAYHLSRAGLHVEFAENGRIAVEKALRGGWDVILMDIQMPELDGYGATLSLRRSGYSGPIIALTSHALRDDRDKFQGSGLTDYLTKPIKIRDLLDTIARYLPPDQVPSAPSAPDEGQGPDTGTKSLAPEEKGDFSSLARKYTEHLPQQIQTLRTAWESEDWSQLGALAHQLSGSAGMYGLTLVGETAGLLAEAVAEGQDPSLLRELIEELEAAVPRRSREVTN